MKANDVLAVLNNVVRTQKTNGLKELPIFRLEAALAELAVIVAREGDRAADPAELEQLKARLASNHEWGVELMRATVAFGQFAIKSAILINGGATVALLAFIGNIWKDGGGKELAAPMSWPLGLFAFGVLAGAIAAVGAYVAQAGYAKDFGKWSMNIGRIAHGIGGTGGISALVLFGWGVCATIAAIRAAPL